MAMTAQGLMLSLARSCRLQRDGWRLPWPGRSELDLIRALDQVSTSLFRTAIRQRMPERFMRMGHQGLVGRPRPRLSRWRTPSAFRAW